MIEEFGRVDPALVASLPEPASGLGPTGDDPARDEFCARFKARMLATAGETFDDGDSIAEYADETGPTYWDDPDMRAEGPEECADADMSYWGED